MKKWHLWLAASIGLVVIVGMMIREFDVEVLSRIDLSPRFFLGVVMGVLLFAVQNLMLTLRFRHLCQRKLSVAEAFRINVLCEFTSAVTPSAVGGSGLAFVYLNREGVSMGRSIFTMFAALLADEAFLAISCVLLYFCVPSHLLFSLADGVGISADATNEWIKGGVQVIFIVSTLIVTVWTAILYLLLLHRPQILGWVLKGCCKIPFLRRFLPKVEKFSEEMTMASEEAKLEGKEEPVEEPAKAEEKPAEPVKAEEVKAEPVKAAAPAAKAPAKKPAAKKTSRAARKKAAAAKK